MPALTTHVLDTSAGLPAGGVTVDVFFNCKPAGSKTTNADGRTDGPLVSAPGFEAGLYSLKFLIGDYFRNQGLDFPKPFFLDIVTIDFGVSDPSLNHHVPLLISPFGYSTYRGS